MTSYTFLKKEKGLQSIYSYISLSNGLYQGSSTLLIAFFQSTPSLGTTLYALLTVFEFMGRTLGGFTQLKYRISVPKRFQFSIFVYFIYASMDLVLLFIRTPFMMINRMIVGFLGIHSATLRESSVQTYLPNELRGKINAFVQVLNTLSAIIFRIIIGFIGEFLPYPYAFALCSLFNILLTYLLVYRNKTHLFPIYNRNV